MQFSSNPKTHQTVLYKLDLRSQWTHWSHSCCLKLLQSVFNFLFYNYLISANVLSYTHLQPSCSLLQDSIKISLFPKHYPFIQKSLCFFPLIQLFLFLKIEPFFFFLIKITSASAYASGFFNITLNHSYFFLLTSLIRSHNNIHWKMHVVLH